MDIFLSLAFTIILSYLFGSLNSAIIVCRVLKHKDIKPMLSNDPEIQKQQEEILKCVTEIELKHK